MIAGPRRSRRSSSGFSLIEILVGVTIGLIGIVIMFQVMENAENRKRTTSSGSDAQIAGSIAMHNLERDIRLGGNGFGSSAAVGCTVNAYDTVRGAAFTFPMVPVQIVDGVAGAADQIITFYGNSPTAATNYSFNVSTATTKKMASTSGRGGLMRGDLVLVTGAGCGLIEITDNTNIDQLTINHATGAYTDASNNAATARFNAPAGYTLASGQLYSLGNNLNPRRNIWQIANRKTLTVTDDLHNTAASEVGEGIVNLQAEYGLDTDGDFQVDLWQTAAPGNWRQLFAIRVGLLARSQQYEKVNVTTVAPAWESGSFTMTNLDGTTDNAPNNANDWRHYRYRVYQVTMPLRNMIWGVVP
jgi:type IV pilus assembly protein PilW